ncbi:MAG: hypothetical protein ABH860_05700 [bacterium]
MENLEKSLKLFAAELEKAKNRKKISGYVLIGGLAVSARAKPRATYDIDFLVIADKSYLTEGISRIAKKLGYSVEISKGEASDPLNGMVRIYTKDGEALIDIIPTFWKWQDEIVEGAQYLSMGGGEHIPIARIEDMVVLKLKAGGPQDLIDTEELLKAADLSKNIDPERLFSLAKRAKVDKKLDRILHKLGVSF